uniref:Uncharacterized protein n=1 Tax=Chromera velia CCMP2878 TaxID=1169474 RepID=A0A0G4FQN4_9ALVE|eukprot:Cvel_18117.t1-p1 / transcript=Cvel_18117.t1 / gene=Cvel_18117 / organism=Chromera_velia_CCMP2878 / gene_product=hypothetical protein / transcript_product=hypothetical protein / location=Cvel_scaffold1486:8886-13622(+) / protein_length=819 / sequence_SO=supercontig / SO=protein_coding / is_pseudo=false
MGSVAPVRDQEEGKAEEWSPRERSTPEAHAAAVSGRRNGVSGSSLRRRSGKVFEYSSAIGRLVSEAAKVNDVETLKRKIRHIDFDKMLCFDLATAMLGVSRFPIFFNWSFWSHCIDRLETPVSGERDMFVCDLLKPLAVVQMLAALARLPSLPQEGGRPRGEFLLSRVAENVRKDLTGFDSAHIAGVCSSLAQIAPERFVWFFEFVNTELKNETLKRKRPQGNGRSSTENLKEGTVPHGGGEDAEPVYTPIESAPPPPHPNGGRQYSVSSRDMMRWSPSTLAMLARALARADVYDAQTFALIAERCTVARDRLNPVDVAYLLFAFARVQHTSEIRLFEVLQRKIIEGMRIMDPTTIAVSACGMVKLGLWDCGAFRALLLRAHDIHAQFSIQNAADLLHACGEAGVRDEQVAGLLSRRIIEGFTGPQGMIEERFASRVSFSLAKLGVLERYAYGSSERSLDAKPDVRGSGEMSFVDPWGEGTLRVFLQCAVLLRERLERVLVNEPLSGVATGVYASLVVPHWLSNLPSSTDAHSSSEAEVEVQPQPGDLTAGPHSPGALSSFSSHKVLPPLFVRLLEQALCRIEEGGEVQKIQLHKVWIGLVALCLRLPVPPPSPRELRTFKRWQRSAMMWGADSETEKETVELRNENSANKSDCPNPSLSEDGSLPSLSLGACRGPRSVGLSSLMLCSLRTALEALRVHWEAERTQKALTGVPVDRPDEPDNEKEMNPEASRDQDHKMIEEREKVSTLHTEVTEVLKEVLRGVPVGAAETRTEGRQQACGDVERVRSEIPAGPFVLDLLVMVPTSAVTRESSGVRTKRR